MDLTLDCGANEKSEPLIEHAHQVSNAKQPAWKSFPQAASVRIHLLMYEVNIAEELAGDDLLQPISIPYARFTIFISLANIELASARDRHEQALSLANELLDEVMPLTRVDVPDILRCKGNALLGLGRIDEALQSLTEARSLAKETRSDLHLWVILADLAHTQSRLGRQQAAEENREEARKIVMQIADSLREVELADSFLNLSRVRNLMN